MNDDPNKRLCMKCGKKLPSSNNFCMYCGCNNNLTSEEINNPPTENNEQPIPNKKETTIPKIKKEKRTLKELIIYAFIFLDIIAISVMFILKSDGLFYKKFKFDLDYYDKVINLNNTEFLALKNNKLFFLTTNTDFDNKVINKINKEKVLDIGETYPGSGGLLIETKKNIYQGQYFNLSSDFNDVYKISNPTGNVYKDVDNKINNTTQANDNYYGLSKFTNYYIKDGELYKNEREVDYFSYKNNKYTHKKIMNKEELDMINPTIIYAEIYQNTIIIKGDNIIKIIVDDELKESISSITFHNKTYRISDLKYVLYNKTTFLFVCKNGYSISYQYDDDTSIFNDYYEDKTNNDRKENLNKNIIIQEDSKSNRPTISVDSSYYKSIVILIIAVILLLGVIYYYRNASIIISTLTASGVVFVYMLLVAFYTYIKVLNHSSIELLWVLVKTVLYGIPLYLLIGFLLFQVKEITKYILDKLNIETIYHFCLAIIAIASFLLSIVLYANMIIAISISGIVWVFLTQNHEESMNYIINKKLIIQLVSIILINLILCFILCFVMNINQYYVSILVIAFCLSCCFVLNKKIKIKDYFEKIALSSCNIFFLYVVSIVESIESMFLIKEDDTLKRIGEIFKYNVLGNILRIIMVLVIGYLVALILSPINMFLQKKITSNDNRIVSILTTMIIMVVIVSAFIIGMPYISQITSKVYKIIMN